MNANRAGENACSRVRLGSALIRAVSQPPNRNADE
jgi:hypothetical protein